MTVSTQITKETFSTNGVTVDFPFTFYLTSEDQVFAKTIEADGTETDYTTYTVTINPDNNGGTLTTNTVLDNVDLLIFRDTEITQETDYPRGNKFPAKSHEAALDKLTLISQELAEAISRCLQNEIGASDPISLEDLINKIDTQDEALAQAIIDGDAETLAAAIAYTDLQFTNAGQFFVAKSGDAMTGALDVIDAPRANSAVPKKVIGTAIDSAINTALGILPDGTPRDYGFLFEPVDEVIDLGGLV